MCGIAGLITRHDTIADPALVGLMTHQLSHRGPDAGGSWAEGNVALGHRRLSIIDLTDGANQPLFSPDGRYAITFNGEIYNYWAVRQQLTGYNFQTNSDTEVILAAYERWGAACVHQFNGMFAFAIWDRHTKELFAARDRLGKKPFYYYHDQHQFVFASEVRALLRTGLVPRRLNTAMLPQYLMYQTVSAPNTLVAGVGQLQAGHTALFVDHCWTETRYWNLMAPPPADPALLQNGAATQRQVRSLLQASVTRRMVSDVPLGAFLSGGIDSSAVVALMAEQTEQPVNTFTVTFQEAAFDESEHARQMAKRFNTRHTELPLSARELLAELPTILASMDQPSGDGPNTYMVSKLTRAAGITVALSGLGGDEVFAGYSTFGRYARLQKLGWLWHLPRPVRQAVLKRFSPGTNQQKLADLTNLHSLNTTDLFPLFRQSTSARAAQQLLGTNRLANPYPAMFSRQQAEIGHLHSMSQLTISELLTYTEPLLLRDADQMSMAHALELRVPMLDYELIEFMLRVPDRYKTTKAPKQLLVESIHPLLPGELLKRPKMGFSFPWSQWMRTELGSFCAERIESLSQRNLFDKTALLAYHQRFMTCDPATSWNHIWLLVVLEDWLITNQVE
ncbi:asparagine synthase (glutamine-hydrolyzing) [Fibrella aquatilis]|uniref:asparagine synthase (glutamine-hydrolyzing) n=1 Tax=Fibrella aquatilis TaxID=2817059 RepID=A0A939K1I9_9BACT|nr:asparagine synthase (glutamine-hydrolyzing) [Fibrella aquatilis]MBO0933563.1 asparagine synthase (glutamine-hydrolyzing) [Fibrella aquatilis]